MSELSQDTVDAWFDEAAALLHEGDGELRTWPKPEALRRGGARAPLLRSLAHLLVVVGGVTLLCVGRVDPGLVAVAVFAAASLPYLNALSNDLVYDSDALVTRNRVVQQMRAPEARWLAYPVLLLVGIKLFIEDFPHGQAATLFVALAFVGSALLLVARLLRREAKG